MPRFTESHKAELINKVVDEASRQLGDDIGQSVAPFIRRYYAHVPPEDIYGQSVENLFGGGLAHCRFGKQRKPGMPKVRVYNPTLEEHGWRSEHTVVEVVTDDMPFLVDSVTAQLNRANLTVHLVIHPVVHVRRAKNGEFEAVSAHGHAEEGFLAESFMRCEVTAQPEEALPAIRQGVESVLQDVRLSVEDWPKVRGKLDDIVARLEAHREHSDPEELDEAIAFLRWIYADHFTLLGYRRYAFDTKDGATVVTAIDADGLGLLRDTKRVVFEELRHLEAMPPAIGDFVARPDLLWVTKTNQQSTVHRPVLLDAITVKHSTKDGHVTGQETFIGLFTSVAYNQSAREIPLLRRKLASVLERSGFDPRGHDGKALAHIMETFPRDELFQISTDHLYATSIGILHLQDRQRVAVFVRRDEFERFVTCLIFVPRDRYSTELRLRIQAILERAFAGEITSNYGQLGDEPLARLYVIVKVKPGQIPELNVDELEAEIVDATRTWSDQLEDALNVEHGEKTGQELYQRYANAFPKGYQERFYAQQAIADVEEIERAVASGHLEMMLYRPFEAAEHQIRFKVYHLDKPIVLSSVLPMLEHLGVRVLDEIPFAVRVGTGDVRTVYIHDFGLETQNRDSVDLGAVRDNFHHTFASTWTGAIESDGFNRLVLSAGLTCRQVVVIRAYCKFLRQAGIAFSQIYMEQTLAANAALTRGLVELFETLFDPEFSGNRETQAGKIRASLAAALDEVTSADQDRILRRFVNVVECTLRTNYFQPAANGEPKPYVSFKLDSRRLEELPLPRPMVEVFVYSPRMEGVHLRGGRVARGGIRWSDRPEDFRTEILGLMKAQMVKNAVIVPVGAKGGFVLKRAPDPADRQAFQAEGIACYQMLMRGLLDITDNLVASDTVPPKSVVRYDDNDPYLVVAADKGTATFSDIANGISRDYDFWLGDAFASGGSQGYDHKKMGITARGAWESVKRHFREMGTDTQQQDFTVVGVGDMAGDVFGNGMLLSPHIKMIAAFNHLHIFIDPDPDPEASFAERKRVFELPRSTWRDYREDVLSPGGGIFDRRAKSITLTPEIKARFGIDQDSLTPNALLRILLTAEVDLLWFGGIGTFVKASHEANSDVGDRANDAVRVDAADLRCKVLGEGANLGITQLGRIELARHGGRVNTDFIDNSAGVDCSDHEVNIKILLDAASADGDLTEKHRNALLARMTDEVGQLVLRDNYLQTQAISLIEAEGLGGLENQGRLIRRFEREGRLNRAVEFLPDEEILQERAAKRQGLTRPEISVLFSYCKIWLYEEVLGSDLPDDKHLAEDVVRYFPSDLHEAFKGRIGEHRLRRDLIATSITNSLVNRMGATFVPEIAEKTGMTAVDITRAYIIARDVFGIRDAWEAIESLDNQVASTVQATLHNEARRLIERGTQWFLRNGGTPLDISVNVSAFGDAVSTLSQQIDTVITDDMNSRILHRAGRYQEDGVPESLAKRIAYLIVLPSACDIVRIAAARGVAIDEVASLYFRVGDFLGLGWLRYQAERLAAESHWERLAIAAVIDELYAHQRDVAFNVMDTAGMAHDGAIELWYEANRQLVERTRSLVGELEAAAAVDLSMLTVASRQFSTLGKG